MTISHLKAKIQLSKTTLTRSVLTKNFTKFISKYIMNAFDKDPTKEMDQYVHSVLASSNLLFSVVMSSLYYLSRVKSSLCIGSEKKIWVVTLIVSMKALCDNTYSNLSWEKISGIPLDQLNTTERKLLHLLNYDITLSKSLYFKWLSVIEDQVETFKQIDIPQTLSPVRKVSSDRQLRIYS